MCGARHNLPRVAGGKGTRKYWFRSGDHLLIAVAGLLGALGDAEEFPQDQDGIEALIAGAPRGPEGERLQASYEAADATISYLGGPGTWVAPVGGGRIRVRQQALEVDGLASRVWILGSDGSLSDPGTIDGYGVPEDELPESARAELEEIERLQREAEAGRPERQRREQEFQNRHRVEHLLGVVAAPAGQDPSDPLVSHVVLYDTGTIVNYLLPRPATKDLDPDDPWAAGKVPPPPITLDDGLGTEFFDHGGSVDGNGEGPLRCKREFAPAVATGAGRLAIEIGGTSVTIELGRT
jgi:hypothetical protein